MTPFHRITAVVTLAALLGPAAQSQASAEGDPALLETVAKAIEANQARLTTWSGEAMIDDESRSEGQRTVRQWSATFLVDLPAGCRRWHLECVSGRRTEPSGAESPFGQGELQDVMFLPDGRYELRSQHLRIQPLDAPRGDEEFDPLDCFGTYRAISRPAAKFTRGYQKMWDTLRRDANQTATLTREGDTVRLRVEFGGAVNAVTYDLSRGGNLCEVDFHDSEVATHTTVKYEQHDGAWVPSELVSTSRQVSKGRYEYKRTVRFTHQHAREPLPPDAFAWARLGVNAQTPVQDDRTDVWYIYGDKARTLRHTNSPGKPNPGL